MEVAEGEDDGYSRLRYAAAATRSRREPPRSCATSSPSACSAFRVALMQFRSPKSRSCCAARAREALGNGGWSREDIAAAELGFVDQAILYEKAGRANLGESLFDETRPENERLTALALKRSASRRRRSTSASSTQGQGNSVARSGSTRLSRTRSRTRTSKPSSRAPSPTGQRGRWPRTTSRRRSRRRPRRHTRATWPWSPASSRSRSTAASASPGAHLHEYYKRALWIQAYDGYPRKQQARIAAWLLDWACGRRWSPALPRESARPVRLGSCAQAGGCSRGVRRPGDAPRGHGRSCST